MSDPVDNLDSTPVWAQILLILAILVLMLVFIGWCIVNDGNHNAFQVIRPPSVFLFKGPDGSWRERVSNPGNPRTIVDIPDDLVAKPSAKNNNNKAKKKVSSRPHRAVIDPKPRMVETTPFLNQAMRDYSAI